MILYWFRADLKKIVKGIQHLWYNQTTFISGLAIFIFLAALRRLNYMISFYAFQKMVNILLVQNVINISTIGANTILIGIETLGIGS